VAAGFPLDCAACHGTATWSGASFTHPASFPLTNSHQVACNACHQGGVFQGLDPSCAACHLAEYQATTNPSHVGFQLSQQCESCHNTVTWGQVTFQHQFPIQGGDHGGLGCAQCHDNPANQTAFTCTNCHEHEQKEMDDKHDDVPGYVWLTSACYQCHPTGSK
jgi:hypothetical protein